VGANNLPADPHKKWTETPWLEGAPNAIAPGLTVAGFSEGEQTKDLVSMLFKCGTIRGYSGKKGSMAPDLLGIPAAA
jgi:hypothetical protein